VICYLPCFKELLITCPLSAFLPFQHLFTDSSAEISSSLPPFSGALSVIPSLPLCAKLQFTVYCSVFFLVWGGSVCSGGHAGLSQGWLGEFLMMLGAHLFDLPNVLQAGLELAAVMVAAHLFLQCYVEWKSFPWARDSGCWSFDSYRCFVFVKCGSSIAARFWSHAFHNVWFCTLVAILDLPINCFNLSHFKNVFISL
jgi:hypothetical protein